MHTKFSSTTVIKHFCPRGTEIERGRFLIGDISSLKLVQIVQIVAQSALPCVSSVGDEMPGVLAKRRCSAPAAMAERDPGAPSDDDSDVDAAEARARAVSAHSARLDPSMVPSRLWFSAPDFGGLHSC